MLVLSMKIGRRILIDHAGERIAVKVVELQSDRVRLGFEGPVSFNVVRAELVGPDGAREGEQ